MSNGNEPAFPGEVKNDDGSYFACWSGLTKREYMATHILCGSLASGEPLSLDEEAAYAVRATDALLSALEGGEHGR